MPVITSASVDAVCHQFWTEFAQGDRFWWWPVDVRVDPNELIADDDEGHLYRVPFSTDGDGNVTFDDPVRVVQEFRDIPEPAAAARSVLAAALDAPASQRVLARFPTAATARPRDRVRASQTPDEGSHMNDDERKQLAVKVGLSEDATEEQINEKLRTDALAEQPAPAEPDPAAGENDGGTAAGKTSKPVAASIDEATLEQLKEDARLGREAREQQMQMSREQFVDAAIAAGKFPPARRDHYLALMSRDEQGTREFVNGLAAGLISTEERGTAPAQASTGAELGWFPQYDVKKETVNG